jgi:hypothetical protein
VSLGMISLPDWRILPGLYQVAWMERSMRGHNKHKTS